MTQIQASVGRGGSNRRPDVAVVQQLLTERGFRLGIADGLCGRRTVGAIETFQSGFLRSPDGRIDPDGRSWRELSGSGPAPVSEGGGGGLLRRMPRPPRDTLNHGIVPVSNRLMTTLFGAPRENYNQNCQPVTNPRMRRMISTLNVGPFRATGLTPALQSLRRVFADIQTAQPEVCAALGTAGMLCARYVRGSTTSVSNHAWGTAIDLTLNGVLDRRGDGLVQYGLTLIAPIFNRHGWYWGAAFRTEDAMHFEAGRALVETWASLP